jgi:hypothetical protein
MKFGRVYQPRNLRTIKALPRHFSLSGSIGFNQSHRNTLALILISLQQERLASGTSIPKREIQQLRRSPGLAATTSASYNPHYIQPEQVDQYQTLGPKSISVESTPQVIQSEWRALVEDYGDEDDLTSLSSGLSEAGMISISSKDLQHEIDPKHASKPVEPKYTPSVRALVNGLQDKSIRSSDLFDLYRALPEPRPLAISPRERRALLRRLSVLEKKTSEDTARYLSVIRDFLDAKVSLNKAEWNSLIHLTGRWGPRTNSDVANVADVDAALTSWALMEQEGPNQSGSVTFSILFDIAIQAGKHSLADMILSELKGRNLKINRYIHTNRIVYFGWKQDGAGVRRAYRELIQAGEIVDTVVLNAVIGALIECGEPWVAESVYERMKRMHSRYSNMPLPPANHRQRRGIAKVLRGLNHKEGGSAAIKEAYKWCSVAPDQFTYKILIKYHCLESGDFERIVRLLSEMAIYGVGHQSSIFLSLFNGFIKHGEAKGTKWKAQVLEMVWSAFTDGVRNKTLEFEPNIAQRAITAFDKLVGADKSAEIEQEVESLRTRAVTQPVIDHKP